MSSTREWYRKITNIEQGDDEPNIYIGNGKPNIYRGLGSTDSIFGARGNDRLFGDDGDDYVYGEKGNDRVVGGEEDNLVSGGPGNDRLVGGLGFDNFEFKDGFDVDHIIDFVPGIDMVVLTVAGIESIEDLLDNHMVQKSGSTVIKGDAGDKLYIDGIKPGQLGSEDFEIL